MAPRKVWLSIVVLGAALGCAGSPLAGGSSSGSGSRASSSGGSSTSGGPAPSDAGGRGPIGPDGGQIDNLVFAVVGDTRPATADDVAGYPTALITQIYGDLKGLSPTPAFAIGTGDYLYTNPGSGSAAPQIAAYLGAWQTFGAQFFPAMGNHECTGYTSSECGPSGADGTPENFDAFMTNLLSDGLGIQTATPYYERDVSSSPGITPTWTAKFVFVACNGWDSAQATWLQSALARSTTYTFVVRHESVEDDDGKSGSTCPGGAASSTLIQGQAVTLLLVGHTHEFKVNTTTAIGIPELVVGNGGAPLDGKGSYGYVVCAQQPGGELSCEDYDYQSNAPKGGIVVTAAGKVVSSS